jgi:hypothetical protein
MDERKERWTHVILPDSCLVINGVSRWGKFCNDAQLHNLYLFYILIKARIIWMGHAAYIRELTNFMELSPS